MRTPTTETIGQLAIFAPMAGVQDLSGHYPATDGRYRMDAEPVNDPPPRCLVCGAILTSIDTGEECPDCPIAPVVHTGRVSEAAPSYGARPTDAAEVERQAEAEYLALYNGKPPIPWRDSVMTMSRDWFRKGVAGTLPDHEQRRWDELAPVRRVSEETPRYRPSLTEVIDGALNGAYYDGDAVILGTGDVNGELSRWARRVRRAITRAGYEVRPKPAATVSEGGPKYGTAAEARSARRYKRKDDTDKDKRQTEERRASLELDTAGSVFAALVSCAMERDEIDPVAALRFYIDADQGEWWGSGSPGSIAHLINEIENAILDTMPKETCDKCQRDKPAATLEGEPGARICEECDQ